MTNERIRVVGTNIAEKAAMIWNVADMLRGPFTEERVSHDQGDRAYHPCGIEMRPVPYILYSWLPVFSSPTTLSLETNY